MNDFKEMKVEVELQDRSNKILKIKELQEERYKNIGENNFFFSKK